MVENDMLINIGIIIFIAERTLSIFTKFRKNDFKILLTKINELINEIRLERLSRRS
jgi:hypothetical protein